MRLLTVRLGGFGGQSGEECGLEKDALEHDVLKFESERMLIFSFRSAFRFALTSISGKGRAGVPSFHEKFFRKKSSRCRPAKTAWPTWLPQTPRPQFAPALFRFSAASFPKNCRPAGPAATFEPSKRQGHPRFRNRRGFAGKTTTSNTHINLFSNSNETQPCRPLFSPFPLFFGAFQLTAQHNEPDHVCGIGHHEALSKLQKPLPAALRAPGRCFEIEHLGGYSARLRQQSLLPSGGCLQ